ncbi:hypothetical protein ABFS83_13G054000 [Erythranthe nasuta]
MGSIIDATILHHVCIVLLVLWFLNSFNYGHPVVYFLSLIYLYLVHEGYVVKLTKKLQFEEKRESNQKRVLVDSETVRWLNHAVEKMWPICMEEIVSQKMLLPIVPWFLKKYKPWTAKDIELQHLYLGRSPPILTEMRVLQNANGDDHLVIEAGLNFRTAEDMSAILQVKLRRRLGFGMTTKLHLLGMHIEGKVLVGVKFLRGWPFISRLRVCFVEPPYFQMTVKPIFTHGLDVTELPGIAGWIDNLLALVFEQTLVEPNMLVVDVEKFASPKPEKWFSVDAKDPIAYAVVEVLDAADMNPSDMNGLADPYVKGQLGPYRFRTKTQKKTLAPKWSEEFKIPICSWESQNLLRIEVRDKDHLYDDMMGDCSVNINEFRGGQRHDMWLSLQNIKMGRLHLAVTVSEETEKEAEPSDDAEVLESDNKRNSFTEDSSKKGSFSKRISFTDDSSKKGSFSSKSFDKSPRVADKFEPIDIDGKPETGIWIHHPGSEVAQVWEPRKGKLRHQDSHQLNRQVRSEANEGSSTDEGTDPNISSQSTNPVRRGLRKIGSVFRRSSKTEEKVNFLVGPESYPKDNIRSLNAKKVGVKLIIDETMISTSTTKAPNGNNEKDLLEETGVGSPRQGHVKDVAKGILKSARDFKHTLSRRALRKSKSEIGSLPPDQESSSDEDESRSSSIDTSLGHGGLVISGSAVSNVAKGSGNSSFKVIDDAVRVDAVSGNSSFKGRDDAMRGDAVSGNSSFKSDSSVGTPRGSNFHTPLTL